jgi:antirestriction protein ArdC
MWMTFNQATELNAYVRKGEKGTLVVYANSFKRVEQNAEGQDVEREIPFLKGYTVSSAADTVYYPQQAFIVSSGE